MVTQNMPVPVQIASQDIVSTDICSNLERLKEIIKSMQCNIVNFSLYFENYLKKFCRTYSI